MLLTYKYRLKDRRAKKVLASQAIACNQVWNWCSAQQRDTANRYRAGAPPRKWQTHFDLYKACNGVGAMLGIPQQTVGEICRQFAESRNRIKRAPGFRASSGSKRALGWVPFHRQSRKVQGNSVKFSGKVFRWFGNKRRPLPDTATSGAFVEDAMGRWWVTFKVEVSESFPRHTSAIGIDLGLRSLATVSDGSVIAAPRNYRRYEQKVATAQRAGNKRRMRAIHSKISNCRADFLHKATTDLVRRNSFIAIGDVSSSKLLKTKMAKSVADAGWAILKNMLRYKCQKAGAVFVEVNEAFSSQTCSSCGCLPPKRPRGIAGLGIRSWECSDCGAIHDRDVNAAKNILRVGLSAQAHADENRKPAGKARVTVSGSVSGKARRAPQPDNLKEPK